MTMIEKTWPITEKLIFNALHLTGRLYWQLSQEADILGKSPQADVIAAIAATKKQLVMQLEQFHQQCGQILATEQLPNNRDGMRNYFKRAQNVGLPVAEVMDQWTQIQRVCGECRTLNEKNGAGIELLAYHAKRSLQILKGGPRDSNTYGPDGATQSAAFTHTLILV
jgi:flagella synthesis protein FlgN